MTNGFKGRSVGQIQSRFLHGVVSNWSEAEAKKGLSAAGRDEKVHKDGKKLLKHDDDDDENGDILELHFWFSSWVTPRTNKTLQGLDYFLKHI